jgi:hypothetical protein
MTALKTIAVLAALLAAGCADKTKEADRLNGEAKAEVCRIKESLPPMAATMTAAEREAAVAGALAVLSEKARKSPALIAKTGEVNAVVKDFKPSDRFTYLFDASRLDESTVRQIVEAQCPFEFIDDAVEAPAEAPAADALGEPSADGGFVDEAAMAAAEDAGIAAAEPSSPPKPNAIVCWPKPKPPVPARKPCRPNGNYWPSSAARPKQARRR